MRGLQAEAKQLYHSLRNVPNPQQGTALLAEALENAARHGYRDPELDCFAVLRQACCDIGWELEIGEGSLEERVLRADAILRAAVARVDGEELTPTAFRAPTRGAG